jgi:predicted Zn-dependent protease with MMP-like domain
MTARFFAPDLADFDAMARAALMVIPEPLRGFAKDVVVRVDDFPDDDVCAEMNLESPFEILGLYQGIALNEKDVGTSDTQPDMVFLYRRPILDYWAETGEELNWIVRHVLIHEIGHHFGFSDDDMHALEELAEQEAGGAS